ncbi:MAG: 50S ribosomal protein L21 [Chloroflexi bacterium RBG_16_68_14]|nr:MAG: 50S ribosomal protein L21 [Chloroflexi bacterium RBG_16_68_14]
MSYAIVRTGGKQYRVEEGRSVVVERLPAEEGATVELLDVLLIADDGQVTVGTPIIEGARVLAQVEANGRAKKIIVFKYKSKVRTRKKTGHRQAFTRLTVTEILRPGQESKTIEKPKRRRARKKAEAPAEAPAAEAAVEAAEAVAEAPAPKRRPRRVAAPEAEAPAPKRRPRRVAAPEAEAPAPKRPARRRPAAEAGVAETPAAEEAAPKRRARRPAAETAEEKPKAARSSTARGKTETKETE